MTDGFYHGKDKHYGVQYTPEELRIRSLESDAEEIYTSEKARIFKTEGMPDENGVIHSCLVHGKSYILYDSKKNKTIVSKSCPQCGVVGIIIGTYNYEEIPRWSDNEY